VPVAIAPELTSTIRRPSRIAAMSAARAPIRSGAAPTPAAVNEAAADLDDEPAYPPQLACRAHEALEAGGDEMEVSPARTP